MLALIKLLIALTAVKIASARNDYSNLTIADHCPNAPDVDWTKSVNTYLRQIPDTIPLPVPIGTLFPGIKIGTLKVTGLGGLWPYKPYTSYCVENKTYIEVPVFADEPLRISVDWKTCSGHQGEFGIRVSSQSLRLFFFPAFGEQSNAGVALFNVLPDSLEDPALFLEGGSQWLSRATLIANVITMPHLEMLWSKFLRVDTPSLIRENLKNLK
ncbi:uncharacterized protein LOC144150166 [Haemaphysalis longicornis]